MSVARLTDKLLVIARRDLLTAMRYRSGVVASVLGLLVEITGFYFLARAIGRDYSPDGVSYFPFLVVGTGFYTFLVLGISTFVESVRDAQVTGTMEVLMTTSTAGPTVIFLAAVSAFGGRVVQFATYLIIGFLVFRAPLNQPNVLGGLVIFILSMLVAISIGITAAAAQIVTQRGHAILTLFASLTWLATGVMFPVSALPAPLQPLARILPVTQSLDGLRMTLLTGAPLMKVVAPIVVLGVYAIVFLPLSMFFLSYALQRARLRGTLSAY